MKLKKISTDFDEYFNYVEESQDLGPEPEADYPDIVHIVPKIPQRTEYDIYAEISAFLEKEKSYRKLDYHFDGAAMQRRGREIRNDSGWPDLVIVHEGKVGFFEIKRKTPYRQDGVLKKNSRLVVQSERLAHLRTCGVHAQFCVEVEGFIESYRDFINSQGQ